MKKLLRPLNDNCVENTMATVAQVMAETLKELGVRYVFGVPSGNWVEYMAAIEEVDGLEFILISNEGSGGFMADVCWRLTGTVAACFGTFGPGACNQTTGVCGGYLDRSPMIAFSDEMGDAMLPRVSQMNIDHQTLFKPITKWTTRLQVGKIKETLLQGMQIAVSEVPGPVHIGLPAGIGAEESGDEMIAVQPSATIRPAGATTLTRMAEMFASAQKPVVALGITSIRAGARQLILRFLEKFKIPVVLTPMAKGMVPEDNLYYAGVLAHALADQVGVTHQQADLVVAIGYDPVELNYEDWMPKVPLLHIDTTPADLDKEKYTLGCDVVGNIRHSLEYLLGLNCGAKKWCIQSLVEQKEAMFRQLAAPPGKFGARKVLDGLRLKLPKDGIMVCDVGAHLHLIGQHWKTPSPECQLMTNGCSSMGFAIPAAIAAQLSCPERRVCCVVGDGGFLMMAGEMATAKRLGADIVFVVVNDAHLSLITIKKERKGFGRRGTELHTGTVGPGPEAAMFGVPVYTAKDAQQYDQALLDAFAADGPAIVEAIIDIDDYEELVLKGNR